MCAVRWDCAGCSLTSATRKTASEWCSWHNTIGSGPVQCPQQFHSVIIFFITSISFCMNFPTQGHAP